MQRTFYNNIMKYELYDADMAICAKTEGAELISLQYRGREYLWSGASPWESSSPILFPFAGRRKNLTYLYEGVSYPMPLNGFAKDFAFTANNTKRTLSFSLRDDETTRKMFPFAFLFQVAYQIRGNSLSVSFLLENRDTKPMPCMWGLHPGFQIEDPTHWLVEFERQPTEHILNDDLLLSGEQKPFPRVYRLDETFAHARILDRYGNRVKLYQETLGQSVTIQSEDPDVLVLWRPPVKDVPLLAIEPWCGISDDEAPKNILQNPHVRIVRPGQTFSSKWQITLT